jgi:hypothetical protein
VVNKLGSAGVLNNAYIFFTSDNVFEMGEHRIGCRLLGSSLNPAREDGNKEG